MYGEIEEVMIEELRYEKYELYFHKSSCPPPLSNLFYDLSLGDKLHNLTTDGQHYNKWSFMGFLRQGERGKMKVKIAQFVLTSE